MVNNYKSECVRADAINPITSPSSTPSSGRIFIGSRPSFAEIYRRIHVSSEMDEAHNKEAGTNCEYSEYVRARAKICVYSFISAIMVYVFGKAIGERYFEAAALFLMAIAGIALLSWVELAKHEQQQSGGKK